MTQLTDSGVAGWPATLFTEVNCQAGTSPDWIGQGDTATAMSCLLNPTLGGYGLHMPLRFTPLIANPGAFTLNIYLLGAKVVKKPDCMTDPDPGYFQPGRTYHLIYNGTTFCEAHGGSDSSVARCLRVGSACYPYPANLPHVSGWTGVNFTGATFATTGTGGAVQMQSESCRSSEALNLRILPPSATQSLPGAIASGGLGATSLFGGCGAGGCNSVSWVGYVLQQKLRAASAMVREAGYASPTLEAFAGNAVLSSVGTMVYLQLQISGSNVIASYSTTAAREAGFRSIATQTCQLFSWSTFESGQEKGY